MEYHIKYAKRLVALLFMGSAILLFSCVEKQKQVEPIDEETLVSRLVDSMRVVTSENGRKSNVFITPLLEDYEFARVPYTEYRKGIEVIAYNDSTGVVNSHIVSNYALHWTARDLWELKGNVVVEGEEGRTLYTQQLFWDRKIKKIYSNVDSKVVEGRDVFIGEGFDADDDFNKWTFRRLKGRVGLDVEPTAPREQSPGNDSLPTPATESGSEKGLPTDPEQ